MISMNYVIETGGKKGGFEHNSWCPFSSHTYAVNFVSSAPMVD